MTFWRTWLMTIRPAWNPQSSNQRADYGNTAAANISEALQAAACIFSPGQQRFAVRSSAIGEDGEISFAGQYTSVLNVAIPDLSARLQTRHCQSLLRFSALLSHASRPG
jgi:hypothetical protein